MGRRGSPEEPAYVTVKSQINLIRLVAMAEILFGIIVLVCQTVAIAFSHEFATRSLTGIWTSWFFLMSAGVALFWSTRCTFNGLLTVLVLQIVSAAMGVPLFTSSCLIFGIYPFRWSPAADGKGTALITSSIVILTTTLVMMMCSIAQLMLNSYNAYNCYILAYGETKEEIYDGGDGYDENIDNNTQNFPASNGDDDWGNEEGGGATVTKVTTSSSRHVVQVDNPPSDSTFSNEDILVIKYCGVTGVILAFLIFCCQTAMFALASEIGINIGVGIWGALFYAATGVITVYNSSKPTAQSAMAIFTLQTMQFVMSVPLVGISYYILAVFGSCSQEFPVRECPQGNSAAGISLTCLSGTMALSGTVQGLTSLTLMLICSQSVCGTRCMISGASVYPKA